MTEKHPAEFSRELQVALERELEVLQMERDLLNLARLVGRKVTGRVRRVLEKHENPKKPPPAGP
jgi:hypothetical protein